LYYNHDERRWCIDDDDGRGMYLANPAGSLLLPPTVGWITLTGRRDGAPTMSFV
jgi:hypothetical protein